MHTVWRGGESVTKKPVVQFIVRELNKPSPEAIERFNEEALRIALRIARDNAQGSTASHTTPSAHHTMMRNG